MAQNNFKPFAIGNNANVTAQADYEALAALATGFQSGKASSSQINKALRQSTTIASVLAQYISNLSGADVLDNGDTAGMLANLLLAIQQSTKNYAPQVVTSVVGTARNLTMNVTAASATATITADEIIVETALGGSQYRIGPFSKTLNLATTGAGGMDTGTAPANGFVAIYVIYNPVSGASALLGVNATSVKAPEVYGGANMPSGYTSSALVSVWPVHSVAGQFAVGLQVDREISFVPKTALNTTAAAATLTSLSIAAIVPINARLVNLACGVVESSAGTGVSLSVAGTASQVGIVGLEAAVSGQTASNQLTLRILMAVSQTIYYLTNANTGTRTISVFSYEF